MINRKQHERLSVLPDTAYWSLPAYLHLFYIYRHKCCTDKPFGCLMLWQFICSGECMWILFKSENVFKFWKCSFSLCRIEYNYYGNWKTDFRMRFLSCKNAHFGGRWWGGGALLCKILHSRCWAGARTVDFMCISPLHKLRSVCTADYRGLHSWPWKLVKYRFLLCDAQNSSPDIHVLWDTLGFVKLQEAKEATVLFFTFVPPNESGLSKM